MEKRCFTSENAPAAVGPYSHAVAADKMLFVSGQIPINPDGSGVVPGGIEEQSRRALDNLKLVLEDCGASLDSVVKTTVFLTDMGNFAAFNGVYGAYFTGECPARACVAVAGLPLGVLVEVEAIALLS